MVTLRIIEPSGKANEEALQTNVARLRDAGINVLCDRVSAHPDYPNNAGSPAERAAGVQNALTERDSDIVIATRGGYGASDLIPYLDFQEIRAARAKALVGFSDICALHSALLSSVGRVGLHGPMPGSPLFVKDKADVDALIELITQPMPWRGSIQVSQTHANPRVDGWLFGGNLAVLTNLIGTPWFPASLAGAIVFLEDVGEHAGRLGRYLSQWQLAGKLDNISAVVLGRFTDGGSSVTGSEDFIVADLCRRLSCPVFTTQDFGHTSPNMPLAVGANATIDGTRLNWSVDSLTPWS